MHVQTSFKVIIHAFYYTLSAGSFSSEDWTKLELLKLSEELKLTKKDNNFSSKELKLTKKIIILVPKN